MNLLMCELISHCMLFCGVCKCAAAAPRREGTPASNPTKALERAPRYACQAVSVGRGGLVDSEVAGLEGCRRCCAGVIVPGRGVVPRQERDALRRGGGEEAEEEAAANHRALVRNTRDFFSH